MATVTLDNINKVYENGFHAIHDLSIDIDDGEFLVLVGPSGCGKSTALRMIAGLETITGGEMKIGEKVVNDVEPKDRDIAMVFQNYALYPHMSVYDNIGFALKLAKVPKEEIDRRVRQASKILELDANLDRKPGQLSGGQRQRVAMGRAIVRQPAAFLMDEPLSNLDAKLRVQMRAEISKLQKRLKTTTVYVTHDQVEAMTMGDRIAILRDGDLQQVGTPLDIYRAPANTFVATFIGTPPMNLLDAEVQNGRVSGHGFDLPLPDELAERTTGTGHKLVIGLRPEHLRLDDGPPEVAAPVHLEVEVVEPLGHETLVHGRIAGGPLVTAIAPAHFAADAGARVELSARVNEMHLFDAGTRDRL
ncbi:MAG: sn-glycerol-3-phosphate ABC transporter ATP-binding protein UgpC [Actinomycetota bacterium]